MAWSFGQRRGQPFFRVKPQSKKRVTRERSAEVKQVKQVKKT